LSPTLFESAAGDGVLSVGQLTARIKRCLEGSFRHVQVEGEVSNYKHYPSGHRYFSLKDDEATIRVVLFKGRERFISGEIRDGQTVMVTGQVAVFEKKGDYQIYAQSAEVRGRGALLLELEKLKARLAAEGLFDPSRKRPLPPYPRHIGIVTSRQGAVLRDMVRIARKRWPAVRITLAPAQVQGEGAASDIADAIRALGAHGTVELLIVGRGGGSIEDLWAFNEEPVVRALAACPIPTISAVGHETDFTLADLAADHRAPTPTAAAQMALPDRGEAAGKVGELVRRARRADAWRRDSLRRELRAVSGTLLDPRPLLHARRFAVAEATNALVERLRETIRNGRVDTTRLLAAVRTHSPEAWLARRRGDLDVLRERAVRPLLSCQAERSAALSLARGKLAALDPKAVLTRGYAIVVSEADGRAIRSVTEVAPDDPLRVQVADGEFRVVARERP
jgi:exodeoxyribonuclease VII large subunit